MPDEDECQTQGCNRTREINVGVAGHSVLICRECAHDLATMLNEFLSEEYEEEASEEERQT